jgi:malonyl-CoA O-methyltransferase
VVELGCGTGKNTEWLAARGRSVLAMDLSPRMLARARERLGARDAELARRVRFVEHDLRERPWPITDASADVVVGNLVLEHVESLDGVFAEAARVLRPLGRLFFCELHPFRQLRGGQAHFTSADGGDTVHVPAFLHDVSEYVRGGLSADLTLCALEEWRDEPVVRTDLPRLLSVLFEKRDEE